MTDHAREENLPLSASDAPRIVAILAEMRRERPLGVWQDRVLAWANELETEVAALTAAADRLRTQIAELHDLVTSFDAITNPEEFPDLHERAFQSVTNGDHTICQALEAAEGERDRLHQALAWQPIETAPKERSILAFEMVPRTWAFPAQYKDLPNVFVAHWWDGDKLNQPRWNGGLTGQPTHWMPLPDPPDVALAPVAVAMPEDRVVFAVRILQQFGDWLAADLVEGYTVDASLQRFLAANPILAALAPVAPQPATHDEEKT